METVTTEMDELEKVKIRYQYLAKLQEIKIQKIKLRMNLEQLDKEEEKLSKHLEKMNANGED